MRTGVGLSWKNRPPTGFRVDTDPAIDSPQEAAQPIGRHLKVKTTSDALNKAKRAKAASNAQNGPHRGNY
jgi:hypothetical protein